MINPPEQIKRTKQKKKNENDQCQCEAYKVQQEVGKKVGREGEGRMFIKKYKKNEVWVLGMG